MSDRIKIDDFATIVVDSVQDVIDKSEDELVAGVKAAGQKSVRLLKQRSRKRKRHGGTYAKGWTCKVESGITGTTCTVYNRSKPSLTHLLEKGHAIANQSGRLPGKVAGDHVIEGVYEEVAEEFGRGAR